MTPDPLSINKQMNRVEFNGSKMCKGRDFIVIRKKRKQNCFIEKRWET